MRASGALFDDCRVALKPGWFIPRKRRPPERSLSSKRGMGSAQVEPAKPGQAAAAPFKSGTMMEAQAKTRPESWKLGVGKVWLPRSRWVPTSHPVLGGGVFFVFCQNRLQKKVGSLILTSLLEDLEGLVADPLPLCGLKTNPTVEEDR